MEERPILMREVGKVAWLFLKVIAAVGAVAALFVWLLVNHPLVGIIAFYCFLFAVLIVFWGWQNYQWKLKDFERERKSEADAEEWKRAS